MHWLEESVAINLICISYVTKRKKVIAASILLTTLLIILAIIIALCVIFSYGSSSAQSSSDETKDQDDSFLTQFELDLVSWIDHKVDPCSNFYNFACGNKLHPSTPDPSFINILTNLQLTTYLRIKNFFDTSIKGNVSFQKVQQSYDACMNIDKAEAILEIQDQVHELGGWPMVEGKKWKTEIKTLEDLFLWITNVNKIRMNIGMFGVVVDKEPENTSNYIVQLVTPPSLNISNLEEFQLEVTKLVNGIYPMSINLEDVENVTKLTKNLQEIQILEDNSNKKDYSKLTLKSVHEKFQINFIPFLNKYFENITKFDDSTEVIVHGEAYFEKLIAVLKNFEIRTIIDLEILLAVIPAYLEIPNILKERSTYGSFSLPPLRLQKPGPGQPTIIHPNLLNNRIRNDNLGWFLCMVKMVNWFQYAVAKTYSSHFLINEEIKIVKNMTGLVKNVFKKRIESFSWMDVISKKQAYLKLDHINVVYAYPKWVDNDTLLEEYYKFFPVTENHLKNYFSATIFAHEINRQLLNSTYLKFNLTESVSSPLDVNAFYYPKENSIYIQAAIMQPPILDTKRNNVYNFAMLGAILGHEITHSLDSEGIKFDENGNYKKWMTESFTKKFKEKSECFVDQYSGYRMTQQIMPNDYLPPDGWQIDGKNTLPENIADNGGIQQTYLAYKEWFNSQKPKQLIIRNFTESELFFLSYAHMWCTKYLGTQGEFELVKSDRHSPAIFRVNGSLSNFEEFSKVFECPISSPMFQGNDSCVLW